MSNDNVVQLPGLAAVDLGKHSRISIANHLRAMADQLEKDESVVNCAVAFALRFDNGDVICPCNGFEDNRAMTLAFTKLMQAVQWA